MIEDWQHFLLPYQQAVNELKVKLRGMRKQFQDQDQHSPIEFVTGRVKPVDSIKEKMVRRLSAKMLRYKLISTKKGERGWFSAPFLTNYD